MACIYDEPLKPYICEADWNCKDCPNWVKSEDNQEEKGGCRNGEKFQSL